MPVSYIDKNGNKVVVHADKDRKEFVARNYEVLAGKACDMYVHGYKVAEVAEALDLTRQQVMQMLKGQAPEVEAELRRRHKESAKDRPKDGPNNLTSVLCPNCSNRYALTPTDYVSTSNGLTAICPGCSAKVKKNGVMIDCGGCERVAPAVKDDYLCGFCRELD